MKRLSNFDLLRVISILLIIMHHYNAHGDFINSNFQSSKLILFSLGVWSLLGVHCFVMVSSHFLYNKNSFSFKKLFRIVFETSLFSFGISFILSKIPGLNLNITSDYLVKCIFAIPYNQYWFMTTYCIFYLLTPFLKKICDNISLESHKCFLVIFFIIFFVFVYFTKVNFISRLGIFIYTYMAIAYFIKKPDNFFQKHYKWLSIILFTIAISLSCYFAYKYETTGFDTKYLSLYNSVTSFESILIYLSSICMYFIFKNMKIKYSKLLNLMGGATLGIYLIHENDYFHFVLFDDIFKRKEIINMSYFPLRYIATCILVLIICAIIYHVVHFILDKTVYKLDDKYLSNVYKKLNKSYLP